MKAVVRYGLNAGEYEFRDVPEPVCGLEDVIVEVKWAAICGSDLAGYYKGTKLGGTGVTGHEFAGVVTEVGPMVTDWKVGDRVVSDNTGGACGKCRNCMTGHFTECIDRKLIGGGLDGGFTKYVRIPGEILRLHKWALVKVPENVPFEYACIMDPICNAYKAVAQDARILPGESVVVFGPGPIGLLAVNLLHIMGCKDIILVGLDIDKEERYDVAMQLGATEFIASNKEDLDAKVKEICGVEGADVVIDCAGAPIVAAQAMKICRKNGTIVRLGASDAPFNYSLNDITYKGIKFIGHHAYDGTSWRNCMGLLERNMLNLDPLITHKLPLEQWREGMELMQSRKGIKILLQP